MLVFYVSYGILCSGGLPLGRDGGALMRVENVHLFSSIDESLLNGWNTFLLFHSLFYSRYFVVGFNVQFDLLSSEGSYSFCGTSISMGLLVLVAASLSSGARWG